VADENAGHTIAGMMPPEDRRKVWDHVAYAMKALPAPTALGSFGKAARGVSADFKLLERLRVPPDKVAMQASHLCWYTQAGCYRPAQILLVLNIES